MVTTLALFTAQTIQAKIVHLCIASTGIDEGGKRYPVFSMWLSWCLDGRNYNIKNGVRYGFMFKELFYVCCWPY